MPLLDSFPELPLLLVALIAVVFLRALRRALVVVLLVALVLFVASAVLNWQPPADRAPWRSSPATLTE